MVGNCQQGPKYWSLSWSKSILCKIVFYLHLCLGVERNQKQRFPAYSVTSWISSGTHQCKQINWSLLCNQSLHRFCFLSAMTKWFILGYHVVSEIYVQEQEGNTGGTRIFLPAFDNWVQVPELIQQNLSSESFFSDTSSWFLIYKQRVALVLVFSAWK